MALPNWQHCLQKRPAVTRRANIACSRRRSWIVSAAADASTLSGQECSICLQVSNLRTGLSASC
jgi:hypothetical protein